MLKVSMLYSYKTDKGWYRRALVNSHNKFSPFKIYSAEPGELIEVNITLNIKIARDFYSAKEKEIQTEFTNKDIINNRT
ncbi:hypothetical protein DICPUDRAFT_160221 [Dictyostelium purpureum]|uniref:Uncharacterized protein n=1 Tax=Dictyostelium purpureum TaxID=5786 RepID=F1A5Y6_DICPU|nr:uncharacterized protein DICPUDRAFT_160221 [Dictyostelium purpureum]EGC28393.1 hypothetical protein DICPUDRAFT_160221 [Dictyostelium purpureum]|eukprot:XP_003295079.1 hypothetical protein DICPUDRAFT_160221 [Dictyostelium purpureum]